MLAAVGVYGVISFGVSQRNQEIGLRMALDAQQGTVARLIVREAFILAFIGLGLGLLGAEWLRHMMQSTLYNVQAFDVSVLLSVTAVLFATALLAAYLPGAAGRRY